jgi:hypothetical protein
VKHLSNLLQMDVVDRLKRGFREGHLLAGRLSWIPSGEGECGHRQRAAEKRHGYFFMSLNAR